MFPGNITQKGHTEMNHWIFELSLEQYFSILAIDSLHHKPITAILTWDVLKNKIEKKQNLIYAFQLESTFYS